MPVHDDKFSCFLHSKWYRLHYLSHPPNLSWCNSYLCGDSHGWRGCRYRQTCCRPRGSWRLSSTHTAWQHLKGQYHGMTLVLNTLRPWQNGCHLPDNIFKCIFIQENARSSIKISLKFVPEGPIDNIPALVQIMAQRQPGDKPLSQPMKVRLLYVCIVASVWRSWVRSPPGPR